jgi:hypothetical protein
MGIPSADPFTINLVCRDIMPDQWCSTAAHYLMSATIDTGKTVMQRRVKVARAAGYLWGVSASCGKVPLARLAMASQMLFGQLATRSWLDLARQCGAGNPLNAVSMTHVATKYLTWQVTANLL